MQIGEGLCNHPGWNTYERDQLLLEIYQKQGNTEKLTELLQQKFKSCHSTATLQDLLDIIGNDKRDEVIADEVASIMENPALCESNAEFLIAVGKVDAAEEYIASRAQQLNGKYYGSLLSLAAAMESEKRNLGASLIYRSLLTSILERGYTRAYSHGIRYLKKLDKLSASMPEWGDFIAHETFKEQILQVHGRKRSFWSNYDGRFQDSGAT